MSAAIVTEELEAAQEMGGLAILKELREHGWHVTTCGAFALLPAGHGCMVVSATRDGVQVEAAADTLVEAAADLFWKAIAVAASASA